ncbi:MAG: hypothetical protein CMJ18_27500 [Phycisphaeraceae bacterium]|nr:hypothetical protein [Phycisphaeraceae bacterium]
MSLKTQAADLARMLTVDPVDAVVWQPQDLSAILRDQMGQSVTVDLAAAGLNPPGRDRAARPIDTFADLLHHARPPIDLLRRIKHFAKLNHAHPTTLPRDVASVLYFASIVVARRRCGTWITDLAETDLRAGIRWATQQTWVDERTRALLADAEGLFAAEPATSPCTEPNNAASVTERKAGRTDDGDG